MRCDVILRIVTVTVAPGTLDAYWAWAGEILALWDAHGIERAGGPYRSREGKTDVAQWLTLHADDSVIEDEFRAMYRTDVGKALIERRPALVAETTIANYDAWPFAS